MFASLSETLRDALGGARRPCLAAVEDGAAFEAAVPLPGVPAERVALSIRAGEITVRWPRAERRLALPTEADPERIRAALRDGVLTLRAPRRLQAC